jgi:hypothetical protein
MDIFISSDISVEPTEFNNTLEIRKQSRFTLRSTSLPSLSKFNAAVRINGANFYSNTYYKS